MVTSYFEQTHRMMGINTPLGPDKLLLSTMSGSEELGRLFEYNVRLASEDPDISLDSMVGQNVTIWLDTIDHDTKRYFNGFVSRFSLVDYDNHFAWYEATIVPWLWFLSRTTNCRIFQNMTVRDIVDEVLQEHGFTDYYWNLREDCSEYVHVVQYRETDLDFVSRLLEAEGIYYWFRHEESKHWVDFTDHWPSSSMPDRDVPFYPPRAGETVKGDHFDRWSVTQQVQPGAVELDDFDFEAPTKKLLAKAKEKKEHPHSEYQVFDYDHRYTDRDVGRRYAAVRLEELQANCRTCEGHGTVRSIFCGAIFDLTEHPLDHLNKEYIVRSASYRLESDLPRGDGAAVRAPVAHVTIQAAESQIPFRPARSTPRPVIQGPQTAIVVGKAGEAIWTDEYGRVKVQFHWDRDCPGDESSGCWARVSQNWAGKGWGGMFVPHVGHEVIVEFLEGDPDYPIVTGRVYNGDNSVPMALPASQETSIISDVAGNKIEMCSTAGSEKITIFSPKENSLFSIGDGCCHQESDGDHILAYKGKREDVVDGDCTRICKGDNKDTIHGNSLYEMLGAVNTEIKGSLTEHVYGILDVKIESPVIKFSGGLKSETFVGGKHSSLFGAEISYNKAVKATYGSARELTVAPVIEQEAKASYQAKAPKVFLLGTAKGKLTGGKAMIFLSSGKITIDNGDAKIVLDGTNIDVSCTNLTVNCSKTVVMGEFSCKKVGKLGF